ncbi:hypothetical protein IWQ62_004937 [Dispira parvispora]|uniref:RNA polymerase II assembly factor Rtp1 C-terminal domain-containing protein n=1 Tax=Dispira parvispora TaxID=1520584 RepID=A0A9W8E1I2_9FUNG|nr:hypothetical protein IWQ62_004937 [Dispira parvispora]
MAEPLAHRLESAQNVLTDIQAFLKDSSVEPSDENQSTALVNRALTSLEALETELLRLAEEHSQPPPFSPTVVSSSTSRPVKSTPESRDKELLGIRDLKLVHSLLDFLVLQGVYPALLAGVGIPLNRRMRSVGVAVDHSLTQASPETALPGALENTEFLNRLSTLTDIAVRFTSMVTDSRSAHGFTTLRSILQSRYLLDLYAALIQLQYLATVHLAQVPSELAQNGDRLDSALSHLIDNIDPFRSLESLTTLLSVRSPVVPPAWFRSRCGQLLSRVIARPQGIQILIAFMLDDQDDTSVTPARLEGLARIVFAVPRQYHSRDTYYQVIAPQLHTLLTDNVNISLRQNYLGATRRNQPGKPPVDGKSVSAITYLCSQFYHKSPQYADRYILDSIITPFTRCLSNEVTKQSLQDGTTLVSEESLQFSLQALHFLLLTNDISVALFEHLLLPIAPLLYRIYDFSKSSPVTHEQPILDILLPLFRLTTQTTSLTLLKRMAFSRTEWVQCAPGPSGGVELRYVSPEQNQNDGKSSLSSDNQPLLNQLLAAHLNPDTFAEFLRALAQDRLVGDFFVILLKEYTSLASGGGGSSQWLETSLFLMNLIATLTERLGPTILGRPGQILEFANDTLERWLLQAEGPKNNEPHVPRVTKDNRLEPEGSGLLHIVSDAEPDVGIASSGLGETTPMGEPDESLPELGGGEELVLILNLISAVLTENKTLLDDEVRRLEITARHLELLKSLKNPAVQSVATDTSVRVHARLVRHSQKKATGEQDERARSLNESRERYSQAMEALEDDIVPIRAHGLIILRDMILSRDPLLHHDSVELTHAFDLFIQMVKNEESYLYLNAVKCLAALTDTHGMIFIPRLTALYQGTVKGTTLDHRLRAGEALLQTVQRSGQVLGKYIHLIVPALLRVLLDEPKVPLRSSAISILSVAAETSVYTLQPWLQEIFDWMLQLLLLDKHVELRRAAIVLLVMLLRGHSGDWFQAVPTGCIKEIYQALKRIEAMDSDQLTRHHARTGLDDLRNILRDYVDVKPPSGIVMLN